MISVNNNIVVVIGLARSGTAVTPLLVEMGAKKVIVNELKDKDKLKDEISLLGGYPQVEVVTGGHPLELIDNTVSLVVKSPGVPPDLPLVKKAVRMGIPVLTEVEIAYQYTRESKPWFIGITGSNGKTTTTALTGNIFKKGWPGKVFVAGNIGLPLSSVVLEASSKDLIVAELSSFQLEGISEFRPHIAAILNISEDHLDYHKTFEEYIKAKYRIFKNQREGDYAVLNADDPLLVEKKDCQLKSKPVLFSRRRILESGVCLQNGEVVIKSEGSTVPVCAVEEIRLPGLHNLENVLAATAIAWSAKVEVSKIREALIAFEGVPHRLEFVRELKGVLFVNDSKATNPGAAIKALQSFSRPVVLIAGGKDKGGNFKELASYVKDRVSFLVLLGETADKIAEAVEEVNFNRWLKVKNLPEAVFQAYQRAQKGDVVLLSPACASWDMFINYEERGELFKKVVHSL